MASEQFVENIFVLIGGPSPVRKAQDPIEKERLMGEQRRKGISVKTLDKHFTRVYTVSG